MWWTILLIAGLSIPEQWAHLSPDEVESIACSLASLPQESLEWVLLYQNTFSEKNDTICLLAHRTLVLSKEKGISLYIKHLKYLPWVQAYSGMKAIQEMDSIPPSIILNALKEADVRRIRYLLPLLVKTETPALDSILSVYLADTSEEVRTRAIQACGFQRLHLALPLAKDPSIAVRTQLAELLREHRDSLPEEAQVVLKQMQKDTLFRIRFLLKEE